MMEGPESETVRQAIVEKLDPDFFRAFIVQLHTRTLELDADGAAGRLTADGAEEY